LSCIIIIHCVYYAIAAAVADIRTWPYIKVAALSRAPPPPVTRDERFSPVRRLLFPPRALCRLRRRDFDIIVATDTHSHTLWHIRMCKNHAHTHSRALYYYNDTLYYNILYGVYCCGIVVQADTVPGFRCWTLITN